MFCVIDNYIICSTAVSNNRRGLKFDFYIALKGQPTHLLIFLTSWSWSHGI